MARREGLSIQQVTAVKAGALGRELESCWEEEKQEQKAWAESMRRSSSCAELGAGRRGGSQ